MRLLPPFQVTRNHSFIASRASYALRDSLAFAEIYINLNFPGWNFRGMESLSTTAAVAPSISNPPGD